MELKNTILLNLVVLTGILLVPTHGADGNGTHGPNSVISMVHHCLFRRSFGEKRCVLHADNCGCDKIETSETLTEYMGRVPTLTCKFVSTTNQINWIFMRWNLIKADNSTVPLAIMTSQTRTAEWLETAPPHFKDHVYHKTEMMDASITFDLRIDGFICTDAGRYMCEIFTFNGDFKGYTDLNIEAHPGTPVISEDSIEVSENESFKVECRANVGIPPQELRWAYKMQGQETYSVLTENVTHENRPTNDCTFEEISKVTLMMTPELDGAVFLCMSSGELGEGGKPMNYDEVTITIHRPPTTTTPSLSSTVIIIDDDDDPRSAACRSTFTIFGLLLSATILSFVKMFLVSS